MQRDRWLLRCRFGHKGVSVQRRFCDENKQRFRHFQGTSARSRPKLMAPLLSLLEALSFVNTGDGKSLSSDKHTRACLSAFRKWNLLTAVLSSFHNECVIVILVLCDSPRVAVWPRFGLRFPQMPPSTAADHCDFRGFLRPLLRNIAS